MFCPKCGKENPDTNQFCGSCGENLLKLSSNHTNKQTMRPIFWGVIGFVVGFIGWIGFNLMSLGTILHGGPNWMVQGGVFLFGLLFLFSLPVAIIAEIIIWIHNRSGKTETNPSKGFPFKPNPLFIIIGIVLIFSLYLLPIHTIDFHGGQKTMNTTAELVTACSTPGWTCEPYSAIAFYGLWILGFVLILFGIFQKKKSNPAS
jgi:hypothetical protein